MKNICIIGGGAAGMMAAYSASLSRGAVVRVFEKRERPGRKLLITGKGRCNITNMGDRDDFINNITRNSSFLYSSLAAFSNFDLITLMEDNGLKTKTERGARVFPVSDKSSDVVDFFTKLLKKQKVEVECGRTVKSIRYSESEKKFYIYFREAPSVFADAVIIATGGLSYPLTGSTGDGHKIADRLGHNVTELFPSLVGLKTSENTKSMAGLTLNNIAVTFLDEKDINVYENFGELIFTHKGVSGPVVLSASSKLAERLDNEKFRLLIDLKPGLNEKVLDNRLLKDFNKYKNKDIINALYDLLPRSIIPEVIKLSGVASAKKVNVVTKSERLALAGAIKQFRLTIAGAEGFDNAIITRGGINVNEINPKTMESKLVKGLFFAGEIIDVDANTGGFNLQIAFSTGFLAGKSSSL